MTFTAAVVAALAFLAGAGVAALLMRAYSRRSNRTSAPSGPGSSGIEFRVGALPGSVANPAASAKVATEGPATTPSLALRVLGAIDVGVVVVDRDEIAIFANPAARQIRAVEDDRLTVPVLSALVRAVTDSGVADSVTLDLAQGRGGPESLTFLVTAMPLGPVLRDERIATVLLRFTDITESRRLERVRRDFVANVSHELKTPVGALTLLAEAVQDAADDPEAVQRFSHRMQREGARLGRLVQELIELSRLQGAEPLPGAHLVDVEHIVSEAVDRSRLLAEQSGITVVDRTEPYLQVRGNETQLTNALSNLVDNAIAYSPERTKVGVSARAVMDADGSEWVEIAVTDQGIGIAEADLDRVFERFFRVDPARSRATGGTGLGLAIVKHIASNHGGAVSVWSVSGSGSTFTIRLPLAGRDGGSSDAEAGRESSREQGELEHQSFPQVQLQRSAQTPKPAPTLQPTNTSQLPK
ncbi:sensor histidine kinase [Jatrophihabitans sp. DSM 45814]